ncbi:MAG: MATE family efflux transporter [Clostridia bacterium]|nr:MATE family efflux transporter [Clostridia bacterium]
MDKVFPGANRTMFKKIFVITMPIVIQNLLDSAVNMADVVMLDAVSQASMSAVSLASQAGSVIFMFLYGIGTGMTMMGSQYWGKGDVPAIEKAQGIAIRYALIIGGTAMAACLLIPEWLMKIYTSDPELISAGAEYLRVWSLLIIPWSVATIYLSSLRATGRVTVCTWVETMALLLNVVLNALFLFVLKMGVVGAALATVIARAIELIVCASISARSKTVKLRLRPVTEHHRLLEKDFARMCVPAIGNDLAWGIAFSLYSAILGHLSSDAVAANAIVNVIRNFGCVFCYGLGSAAGIILGQILGAGEREEAIRMSRILLRLSVIAGAIGGLIIMAAIPVIVPLANLTDQAREYLRVMLWINVFYIMGTAVNSTLIAGVFRAGGDTRFGFRCDAIDMWGWALPLGFIAAFVLKLPVMTVYILLCTDEFVKWPWVFRHYYSNRWAVNITRNDVDGQTAYGNE